MINVNQLRDLIIRPALESLVMYSDEASELLVFTCAVETLGGTFLHQQNGPALGIYQMEPVTYNDIWQHYINYKLELKLKMLHNFDAPTMPNEDRLIYDLRFATAMARIFYERVRAPIPKNPSLDNLWNYYKTYYNTLSGKAEENECIARYQYYLHD